MNADAAVTAASATQQLLSMQGVARLLHTLAIVDVLKQISLSD